MIMLFTFVQSTHLTVFNYLSLGAATRAVGGDCEDGQAVAARRAPAGGAEEERRRQDQTRRGQE